MTVETIADMVWALGQCINVNIFDPSEVDSNDFKIEPQNDAYDPQKRVNLSQIERNIAQPARQWELVP